MEKQLVRTIWFFTTLIILFGLLALYSATHNNVRVPQEIFYDQLMVAGLGILLMFLISRLNYRRFFDIAYIFYGLNILILIYVLISGRHALGARRWMEMGPISFQPSEITKLSMIFLLGRYFSFQPARQSFRYSGFWGGLIRQLIFPFFLTVVPMLLIFKQPDLGTAVLLFGIFILMLFVSGLPYRYLFGFLGFCGAALPFFWHLLKSYQKDRLLVFLNPNIDPLGAGYTIIQSKIAIGSGQLFGKGWLAGTQNQ